MLAVIEGATARNSVALSGAPLLLLVLNFFVVDVSSFNAAIPAQFWPAGVSE